MKGLRVADEKGKVSPPFVFTHRFCDCSTTTGSFNLNASLGTVALLHLRSVRLAIPARVVMGT